ncbi:DNA repair protein RecO [Labeo rohita]|uniref:DNA repair protein RecO n=1 Tax=Labeo rohita TaxID=84645 RepID=A0ABQ8L2F4_LABRO|nr:DNA repair protein RecO [Labeo rohita]
MADEENICGEDGVEQGGSRKLTEKGLEERLQRLIAKRKETLRVLTGQMKEIETMRRDTQNVQEVKDMLESDFEQSLNEFIRLNKEVGNLWTEDEKMCDHVDWFEPKMALLKDFMGTTKRWVADVQESMEKETEQPEKHDGISKHQEAVLPSDSISQIGVSSAAKAHSCGSHVSRTTNTSCLSSTRARQEAEHAALLERAAALKKEQELEFEVARIKQQFEFETARIKVEKEELEMETALAESQAKLKVLKEYERSEDGTSSYASVRKLSSENVKKERATLPAQANVNVHVPAQVQHSRIPQQPQPVSHQSFRTQTDGSDVLQYKSFMRAFEHAIEQKTDNDQDKLYFLEQFTDGEPQELVRSCAHMTPSKGYHKAKKLLRKHYGDELVIANAYIDKALKWPQVRTDDGKALNAYAMFLIGCRISMEDIEFLEEMDNPTNLRTVISKLPYKMKERWRVEAFELKERRGRRARFADLVSFIDLQAKIAIDPLFGNISDSRPNTAGKMNLREKQPARKEVRGSSFAISVATEKNKDSAQSKEVSCMEVPITKESCGLTGAGEVECVLSIVPVKVKSKNNNKHIETYAFLDPGSTATFCTEDLQRKLNVKGKPTRILLSTMGQDKSGEQKLMNSFVISDLEVCRLEDTMFTELPKVFTHSSIPVHAGNIPKQSDIQRWPYLQEVSLPEIEADVGLLIGVNCSRVMEPLHIINGQDGGPYAVKTAIGWVVNGPVRKDLNDSENEPSHFSVNRISLMEIEKLLVQQYNTDFPERKYDDKEEMSLEDKQFLKSVEKTTIFENGHYSIGLPLRNENLQMPNNRCVAEQRLACLLRRFKKKVEFFNDYTSFMESIISKGYAFQVPTDQLNRDDNRVFYIPHHGVYHPKK